MVLTSDWDMEMPEGKMTKLRNLVVLTENLHFLALAKSLYLRKQDRTS